MVYIEKIPAVHPDKTIPMYLQVFHNMLGKSVKKKKKKPHVLYLANKRVGKTATFFHFVIV